MKKFKQLNFIVITLLILTTLSSCKVTRFVIYNFADINDHKNFQQETLKTAQQNSFFLLLKKASSRKNCI